MHFGAASGCFNACQLEKYPACDAGEKSEISKGENSGYGGRAKPLTTGGIRGLGVEKLLIFADFRRHDSFLGNLGAV